MSGNLAFSFYDEFSHTDAKEGWAKAAAFGEAAENFRFVILVDESMEDPYSHTVTLGVLFQ